MDINFASFLTQLGPEQLEQALPMIQTIKEKVSQWRELLPLIKAFEATVPLSEGEFIQYSGMATQDDIYIYVNAISEVIVGEGESAESLIRSRKIHRFVVSELVEKLKEWIPNV